MQTHPLTTHRPLPVRYLTRPAPQDTQPWGAGGTPPASDRAFLSMLASERASGGLARLATRPAAGR
jgi:hypothetical protein